MKGQQMRLVLVGMLRAVVDLGKTVALAIMVLMLNACAWNDIQRYGVVDLKEKTVMTTPGSIGIQGVLKHALVNDGWKLVVYHGPSVLRQNKEEEGQFEYYNTFHARYRLLVASIKSDCNTSFEPAFRYDISFIDNKTGSEVFIMQGNECVSDIREQFMNTINGIQKKKEQPTGKTNTRHDMESH